MQDEFHRLLRETVADGRTVFLSSHDLEELFLTYYRDQTADDADGHRPA
jgi:ABC-type multidrug transport system ATPase subunit